MRYQRKLWDHHREKRKRENFPTEGCKSQPGLLTEQRIERTPKQSWLAADRPRPHRRQRGRWATARARRRGTVPISAPETSIQSLTTSSWGPGRLTSPRRVAASDQLSRGDTWHTRGGAQAAPREPRGWDQGGDQDARPTGTVPSASTWPPELLEPGKGMKCTPNGVCAFVECPRT